MIYIDPPYNTGNDFIYEDDFSQSMEDYAQNSGQRDEEGNRLVQNSETNGRFHTDWLNMMYPRLKIAKDLLTDDGIIFISIDNNEQENLLKICDEIFGESNFIELLEWKRKKQPSFLSKHTAKVLESIVVYGKKEKLVGKLSIESISDKTKKVVNLTNDYTIRHFKSGVRVKIGNSGIIKKGIYKIKSMSVEYMTDVYFENGLTTNEVDVKAQFSVSQDFINKFINERLLFITVNYGLRRDVSISEKSKEKSITDLLLDWGDNQDSEKEQLDIFNGKKLFNYAKPVKLIFNLCKACTNNEDVILDFFSGSASTAHAVMKLNTEDGANRQFIMVQLPELTDNKSEAFKAGFKTICDIGEERIRRAGKKIKAETGADIDYGFRCFYVDSSNMEDVYYKPGEVKQDQLDLFAENVKPDRTPEDLLFQVMLELGILLSTKIEELDIDGKKVFSVDNGYLLACFDTAVTDEVVTAIAKKHPCYAVFRDSGMADDSVMANFEQIFATYSPDTVRKVL